MYTISTSYIISYHSFLNDNNTFIPSVIFLCYLFELYSYDDDHGINQAKCLKTMKMSINIKNILNIKNNKTVTTGDEENKYH